MYSQMTEETTRERKSITFRIDELTIQILDALATDANISRNRYLEDVLMKLGKEKGIVDVNTKPLGETRGKSKN